jgi:ribose 5-phosphate isomerase A
MVVGIGTGEAAGYALERLVERLGSGELSGVSCVPTSEKTEAEVRRLGVPCVSLDTQAAPAVAIGGADAVDGACNLIKGGKGALSREKLVQAEAARYVVVVDEPKLCARVGGAHPVPVEILPVFAQRTLRQIAALPALAPCDARLRYGDAPAGLDGVAPFPPKPFVTDNGNYIVDLFRQAPLDDVAAAAAALKATSGVVEHGLFVGAPSTVVVVGKADGGVDTFAGK